MTCKISFIKSLRETVKHHLAAIFASCIVFFIQLIIFFLSIQNLSSRGLELYSDSNYTHNQLLSMTLPSAAFLFPVMFIAVILGFDFFRYLHSKKQTDFFDSFAVTRKDWFVLRIASAFLVFFLPYMICIVTEIILLGVYGYAESLYVTNLIWNAVCMVLLFLITFLATALAMIMTGHTVIAAFGLCIFCGYAPIILRYIHAAYASSYFETYVSEGNLIPYLDYFSPIGLAVKMLSSDYLEWTAAAHTKDFLILIVLILLTLGLSFFLFLRRPSESAGRAMAFEKLNPYIRMFLVIPLSLYIGLYFSMIASVAKIGWMIFGFLFGTFLLHGIIESIFQFDIRGIKAHKRQMVFCFAACLGIAVIYWMDLFGYDRYVPDLNEVKSLAVQAPGTGSMYRNHSAYDIGAENYEKALLLAEKLVEYTDEDTYQNSQWIRYTYRLKNGSVKERSYRMDLAKHRALFDEIYATESYKDDFCQLYNIEIDSIFYLQWGDSLSWHSLRISPEETENLIETYLAEYTPLTYTESRGQASVGQLQIECTDPNREGDFISLYYDVYPNFTQTISLVEKYLAKTDNNSDYGSLTESPLKKYEILSIDIYKDDETIAITDSETIAVLAENALILEYINNTYDADFDWENYYYAGVNYIADNTRKYVDVMIPCEIVDNPNL